MSQETQAVQDRGIRSKSREQTTRYWVFPTRSPLIFGFANSTQRLNGFSEKSTQAFYPTYTVENGEKCNSRPTTSPNKDRFWG